MTGCNHPAGSSRLPAPSPSCCHCSNTETATFPWEGRGVRLALLALCLGDSAINPCTCKAPNTRPRKENQHCQTTQTPHSLHLLQTAHDPLAGCPPNRRSLSPPCPAARWRGRPTPPPATQCNNGSLNKQKTGWYPFGGSVLEAPQLLPGTIWSCHCGHAGSSCQAPSNTAASS